jgi:integrase
MNRRCIANSLPQGPRIEEAAAEQVIRGTSPGGSIRMLRAISALPAGAALRRVRGSRVADAGLSPDAVIRLLRHAGQEAGLAYRVTGHGLRRGFVTAAYNGGNGWDLLQTPGTADGQTNSGEWGYIHEENRWRRPSGGLDIDPTEDDLARR